MTTNRVAAIVLLVGLSLTACGITPDASPRDVPDDNVIEIVSDEASGSDASGADRIFLVGPGEDRLLESVPRNANSRTNLMEILLSGPNDEEIAAQFITAIPSNTHIVSTPRSQGNVYFIDLSEEILELTGGGLTQALAQIVYTADELDGVEALQLTVNGEERSWPKGNGESTSAPLRVYDYPAFVLTAQPDYPARPEAG